MAPPKGFAAYKKKDGILALSRDLQSVSWTPTAPPGSQPAVTLAVKNITNLQQTPAGSPKVMLKIFAQPSGTAAAETHVFSFTSVTQARSEADALKDILSKSIQAAQTGTLAHVAPGGVSSSAAMAIASAVSSTPGAGRDINTLYDDDKLKSDNELQQSLIKANPSLSRTLVESLRTKPESISNSQLTSQFWSSRAHLLRAHAIERSQTRGAYNVLSTIKPRTEENTIKLSISKEQIQLIFTQHELVKRAYDENVPKLSEEIFWSRFFQSRLFKKLKGERILEADPTDVVLDKYLSLDEDLERNRRMLAAHIPHTIDVEGNEQNHSQRKGNQPDFSMRPTAVDRVPIIRTLNSLSEKIMSHVAPNDVDPSEPIGMDEETFNQLALRDLQADAEENRIILNIKDQGRFFSSDKANDASTDATLYSKQDPEEVLLSIRNDLASKGQDLDLASTIGVDDDSSDSDSGEPHPSHVGSKASLRGATTKLFDAIAQQRAQNEDLSVNGFSSVNTASTCDLSSTIFDRLSLTHATTTEFLHHFWIAFLSGDAARADEIACLVETLDRAMDRIRAVADDADQDRLKEIGKLKKQVRDHYERTHKKLAFNPDSVKGGAKAVNQLMAPTVTAIGVALRKYREALAQEEDLP
ncbi:RNA polymerase II transcription factor B subunit 1 [Lambiella insularis]|nr:RNA polymerase II transcription factor B subunit 1 [Lambiella insularis]